MVTTAVIMAAGLGARFGSLTESIPKGFIKVGDTPMVVRSIETLIDCGIKKIIIGTGYKKECYEALSLKYPQITCCYSECYATTNSMWTLHNCRATVGGDDFLLLESDLVYEKRAITALLKNHHADILLSAEVTKFQDSYYIEHDEKQFLLNCSVTKSDLNPCGELVGICKLSNPFYEALCGYYEGCKDAFPKMGYEFALLNIAKTRMPLYVLKIKDLLWYEIDDEKDLRFAEERILKKLV